MTGKEIWGGDRRFTIFIFLGCSFSTWGLIVNERIYPLRHVLLG